MINLLPRDAAYLGVPTIYLICNDCSARGDSDCACEGSGGIFCALCDHRDLTTLAVELVGGDTALCADHHLAAVGLPPESLDLDAVGGAL